MYSTMLTDAERGISQPKKKKNYMQVVVHIEQERALEYCLQIHVFIEIISSCMFSHCCIITTFIGTDPVNIINRYCLSESLLLLSFHDVSLPPIAGAAILASIFFHCYRRSVIHLHFS